MPKFWTIAALIGISISTFAPSAAFAANCRDAKGKFTKCQAPAKVAAHCRDMKTKKFAKCGTPGAEPMR